jgi:copper homeostasis protein
MLLEVIVTGPDEARIATAAGADRLELVAALHRGGLTPGLEIIAEVVAAVDIPVHVMARPHDRDFRYREDEICAIEEAAEAARYAGAQGIVFGALTATGDIDVACLERIAAASGPLPITFHRAFDETRDPLAALDVLSTLPAVTTVLTSGQAPSAWHGRELLKTLVARGGPPAILAGAGISADNVLALLRATGATNVHVGNGARTDGRIDAQKIDRLRTLLSDAERILAG